LVKKERGMKEETGSFGKRGHAGNKKMWMVGGCMRKLWKWITDRKRDKRSVANEKWPGRTR